MIPEIEIPQYIKTLKGFQRKINKAAKQYKESLKTLMVLGQHAVDNDEGHALMLQWDEGESRLKRALSRVKSHHKNQIAEPGYELLDFFDAVSDFLLVIKDGLFAVVVAHIHGSGFADKMYSGWANSFIKEWDGVYTDILEDKKAFEKYAWGLID